jgi:chaperone required for assembly of F1-ATPase
MKRFYKIVAVAEDGAHLRITLDGRPVKTPNGDVLVLASRALADAVAEEWAGQGDAIDQRTMPLTGLANTAVDHVRTDPQTVLNRLVAFAGHDLVSYRAAEPPALIAREAAAWDVPLAWARERYGLDLAITDSVLAVAQPPAVLESLRRRLATRDAFALTGLISAAGILKSVVLALALADGKLDAAAANAAAHVNDAFQAEKWGWDSEAEARLKALLTELQTAERFLRLAAA